MKASRRWLVPVLAALALAALPGCPSKPMVQLHHAEVRSISPMGLGIQVFLRVTNRNAFDVQIRNIHAQAVIAGRFTVPLEMSLNTWLPAGQQTMVDAPVIIPWAVLPGVLAASVGSPYVTYLVDGTADVTATRSLGIERDAYPVHEEGTISRQVMVDAARRMLPL